MYKSYLLLLPLTTLLSCQPGITNLEPAYLRQEPSVQTYKDMGFTVDSVHTFTVVPPSLLKDTSLLGGGILEQQVLFMLRNVFEERGYSFVLPNQSPDMWVTVDGYSAYQQSYVPPSTLTLPLFSPAQRIRTMGWGTGRFNMTGFGGNAWGTYSGISSSTTTVPGRVDWQTYNVPGRVVGAFFPSVMVSVADHTGSKILWSGVGVGTSDNPDFRVNCQMVLRRMVADFPSRTSEANEHDRVCHSLGVKYAIYTVDGNSYFPVITNLGYGSVASIAGVVEEDMIVNIDGINTENKSLSEIDNLFLSRLSRSIPITVRRPVTDNSPEQNHKLILEIVDK